MSKKCRAYSESRLGLAPADNRKAFYAGFEAALRERLAQPEQEPVARVIDNGTPEGATEWIPFTNRVEPLKTGDLLYTTPPQRPWVDLTPKEIESCRQKGYVNGGLNAPFDFDKAAGALLAKAKEKNT